MSIVKALEFLSKQDILLASGSPRRLEILTKMGVPFLSQLAIPESVENMDYRTFANPLQDYVLQNIRNKLQYAIDHFSDRLPRWTSEKKENVFDAKKTPDLIVAADTVVISGKEILEKPKTPEDNARMLRQLSGTTHTVMTTVSFCLISDKHLDSNNMFQNISTFTVKTDVIISSLSENTIAWYVDNKEGRDKAGGYAIQGLGASLTESINGCFYNVVGFPLNRFLVELNQAIDATVR